MKLHLASLATSLARAATAAAYAMSVRNYCDPLGCSRKGLFVMKYDMYEVNAADGCRLPAIPGMVEFCMDWLVGKDSLGKPRMHYRFKNQGKHCMREFFHEEVKCPGDFDGTNCTASYFNEVTCAW
ncbi:hypothetical protein F5144DRAFT_385514 [Chaetomium tenue]|uniref:Uncharacterized protein n=1 Tax=Chaetomium tenue TaxID=1854479 RepID=A0ACB7NUW3_9PEZI|nr:hypothetical protein F5144DRAFT_385514 [Chaetomium globosum]